MMLQILLTVSVSMGRSILMTLSDEAIFKQLVKILAG